MGGMSLESPVTTHGLYVDGRWTPARSEAIYEVTSPGSGETCAVLAAAGPEDVDVAVGAARKAFARHLGRSPFERADWCNAVADVLDERRTELARELAVEHGKPTAEALGEVASAAEGFRLAAEEGKRLRGEQLPVRDNHKRVLTLRRPKGVHAVVTPFNFPINIPVEYLGPALAAGNAVVWKPAPTTSRIAARLAECIDRAGVPAGLVNLVTGPSLEMSRRLVSHPDVVGVGFTGSSAAGRAIARDAAGKHLLMELGGNGPVIVLGDADLARAASAVGSAAFWNGGQSCAAAGRILAEPAASEPLLEELAAYAAGLRLGPPLDPETTLGPVHTRQIAETTLRHVADAADRGGRVLAGGGVRAGMPTELYVEPTVVGGVPIDALLHCEETFGPLAPVTVVEGDDVVVEATNACTFGLSCAIFTRDVARAIRIAERLEVGQVVVNDTSNYWELHMPFGGWPGKESGIGRIGGRFALEAMTEVQSIAIDLR